MVQSLEQQIELLRRQLKYNKEFREPSASQPPDFTRGLPYYEWAKEHEEEEPRTAGLSYEEEREAIIFEMLKINPWLNKLQRGVFETEINQRYEAWNPVNCSRRRLADIVAEMNTIRMYFDQIIEPDRPYPGLDIIPPDTTGRIMESVIWGILGLSFGTLVAKFRESAQICAIAGMMISGSISVDRLVYVHMQKRGCVKDLRSRTDETRNGIKEHADKIILYGKISLFPKYQPM